VLIFIGPEAYNLYSYKLISNPFIYVIEAGLLAIFLVHLALALALSFLNVKARDQRYAVEASGYKATSQVTKTMRHQGMVILVFVIWHLLTFKFGKSGPDYMAEYGGVVVRDLYRLVIEVFQSPLYVAGYVVAVAVLGFHLSHGVSSAIQTLGFNHPKYTPKIELFGRAYGVVVAGVFVSQPVYVFLFL